MEYFRAFIETLIIVFSSGAFALLIGFPIGIILMMTAKNSMKPMPIFNAILGFTVNVMRSIPFIILLVILLPVTSFIAGSFLGVRGAIVPMVFAAFPFISRIIENSMNEIDKGVIEAANSMGFSTLQIIYKVLIPESMPGIIRGVTLALIAIIGYSAMVSIIAGGGLGALAIVAGYYRSERSVMFISTLLLMIIVVLIQATGNILANKINKK
ncbi:MAG: ABC transporter permease [Erysipelotrichales bacterium]|nr:ABC transporter permease [Erysipelotrichales bacterium]